VALLGSRFWANVVITAIRDTDGTLVGFAKITRDLTERKRSEDERAARLVAEQANRTKDEFLAVLDLDCLAGGGEMGAMMRAMDWAATPLGSVASWPQSLRTAVSIVLGTSFPMMIAWGPALWMLYNDAYLPVLGTRKHPRALGQPLLECFPEISELLGNLFGGVMKTGQPFGAEDMMFPLERHGYTEETYFTFSYSPIRDESGAVGGVLTTCPETTQRVVGARRLRMLRVLAERAVRATTAEQALTCDADVLDPHSFPFAMLYLVDPATRIARLTSSTGIAPGSPGCSPTIDVANEHAIWPLHSVAASGAPTLVTGCDQTLGVLPGGPWPEPATAAMVLPIARPGDCSSPPCAL
jgi:hypothetical protein